MSNFRRAIIDCDGVAGYLCVFPNGVAFAVQKNIGDYHRSLPQVWSKWTEAELPGRIVEWIDEPPSPTAAPLA